MSKLEFFFRKTLEAMKAQFKLKQNNIYHDFVTLKRKAHERPTEDKVNKTHSVCTPAT